MKKLKFESIPDYGDLMTMQVFINSVKIGAFTDYDGFGNLSTETQMSNRQLSPSQLRTRKIPKWATHIVWFNK